jgi:hypothetical protein
MKETYILNSVNARARMGSAWASVCSVLELGREVKVTVEVLEDRHTDRQRKRFHALCEKVAKAKPTWAGHPVDGEGYKRLFLDAWSRAENGVQATIVPSLDGSSIVNLGVQSRKLKKAQMADLMTFIEVWMLENNIELNVRGGT